MHTFSACPHDVAQDPEKWNAFAEYLGQTEALKSRFEKYLSFDEFAAHFSDFDLAYAHPLHAVHLSRVMHFIPLTKYNNVFDEAIVISSKSNRAPSLKDMTNREVACIHGTPSHAATLIDFSRKHPDINFRPLKKANYPDVLMAVAQSEAPYGLILKSVWDMMVAMKDRVVPIYATSTKELVHVFMLSPALSESAPAIKKAMIEMKDRDSGRAVLDRLKCDSLVDFTSDDLDRLADSLKICNFQ